MLSGGGKPKSPTAAASNQKYAVKKLCLTCGESFSKAALPSHQRQCIKKKTVKPKLDPIPNNNSNTAATSTAFCYQCKQHIPSQYFDHHKCERPEQKYPSNATTTTTTTTPPKKSSSSDLRDKSKPVLPSVTNNSASSIDKKKPTQVSTRPQRQDSPSPPPPVKKSTTSPAKKKASTVVVEPQAPVFKPSSAEYSHKEEDEEEEEEDDTPHFPATAGKAGFSDYSDDGGDGAAPVTPTLPCSVCGRKFAEESRLAKHMKACQKVTKPRKQFDATKARVKGTDLEKYVLPNGKPKKPVKQEEQPIKPKKSNWRVKHENFLRMVRAGKAQKHGAALGSAGSYESNEADHKQQQSEENPDYILCDFCERRFSELAAERHIPICKESKRRRELRNGTARNSGKEEERKRRLAFKPPPLKKSQSNLKK